MSSEPESSNGGGVELLQRDGLAGEERFEDVEGGGEADATPEAAGSARRPCPKLFADGVVLDCEPGVL
jgi:hypothetical protein